MRNFYKSFFADPAHYLVNSLVPCILVTVLGYRCGFLVAFEVVFTSFIVLFFVVVVVMGVINLLSLTDRR